MAVSLPPSGDSGDDSYKPLSEINVTPMVDVMLVLLVIFMVAAPLLTVGVPVDLPQTQAPAINQPQEPLVITVNAQGQMFLQNDAISDDQLIPRLQAITKANPNADIYVRGDRQINYGRVMQIMGMVSAAYVLITFWQFRNACATDLIPHCYVTRDPLDVAVFAAAMVGACFGFLWWNASPAQIFMGDTGSLALGGAMAGLAIVTRTELLLVLLGGLFVVITMSVLLQVASYKLTGRRVFLMAPLQHHFELRGWGEVTIVIRFWIIAGLCVGLGLGIFYAEWVSGGPL